MRVAVTGASGRLGRAVVDVLVAAGHEVHRLDRAPGEEITQIDLTDAEATADLLRGIALYKAAGDDDGLKWQTTHADIIRKFGRFPHRNAVLGRKTTAEEQAFLDGGGFAG